MKKTFILHVILYANIKVQTIALNILKRKNLEILLEFLIKEIMSLLLVDKDNDVEIKQCSFQVMNEDYCYLVIL